MQLHYDEIVIQKWIYNYTTFQQICGMINASLFQFNNDNTF